MWTLCVIQLGEGKYLHLPPLVVTILHGSLEDAMGGVVTEGAPFEMEAHILGLVINSKPFLTLPITCS